MDGLFIGFLIMIIAGALPCVVLGYLIAVKQKRRLIAGWDESRVSNPVAYAKLIGLSVLVLGILIGVIGFAWYAGLISTAQMASTLAIASLVPLPCVFIANAKYGKHRS